MTETYVSECVAKVAVRVVQRDFERVPKVVWVSQGHIMDLDC